jgi:hypothetical protein
MCNTVNPEVDLLLLLFAAYSAGAVPRASLRGRIPRLILQTLGSGRHMGHWRGSWRLFAQGDVVVVARCALAVVAMVAAHRGLLRPMGASIPMEQLCHRRSGECLLGVQRGAGL